MLIMSSNKNFGFFFSVFFFIIGLYFYYINKYFFSLPLLIFSVILSLTTIFNANILQPLNLFWYKLGILLGKIVNPVILGIIFFLFFTPISVFFKILKRDELQLKFKQEKSYWRVKKNISNFNEFFKQQF